jgi:hypothetical protein
MRAAAFNPRLGSLVGAGPAEIHARGFEQWFRGGEPHSCEALPLEQRWAGVAPVGDPAAPQGYSRGRSAQETPPLQPRSPGVQLKKIGSSGYPHLTSLKEKLKEPKGRWFENQSLLKNFFAFGFSASHSSDESKYESSRVQPAPRIGRRCWSGRDPRPRIRAVVSRGRARHKVESLPHFHWTLPKKVVKTFDLSSSASAAAPATWLRG